MEELKEIKQQLKELKKSLKNIEDYYLSRNIAYKIECNKGGYVVSSLNKDDPYSVSYDDPIEVLSYLIGMFESTSRYDEKRLYAIRMPGDKNEKYNEHHDYIRENCVGVTRD
jgi:hypothetical protein